MKAWVWLRDSRKDRELVARGEARVGTKRPTLRAVDPGSMCSVAPSCRASEERSESGKTVQHDRRGVICLRFSRLALAKLSSSGVTARVGRGVSSAPGPVAPLSRRHRSSSLRLVPLPSLSSAPLLAVPRSALVSSPSPRVASPLSQSRTLRDACKQEDEGAVGR